MTDVVAFCGGLGFSPVALVALLLVMRPVVVRDLGDRAPDLSDDE